MNIGNWLWNHISNIWEKESSVSTPKYMVATGQVIAGAHKLCWMSCNPSAGNSLWELSDDTTGLTATVIDCFSTARESKGMSFRPPVNFADGIYLKTFTNMTSITFGYI